MYPTPKRIAEFRTRIGRLLIENKFDQLKQELHVGQEMHLLYNHVLGPENPLERDLQQVQYVGMLQQIFIDILKDQNI